MRVAAEWVSCQALCGHWRLSLQLAGSGVLGVAAISKARGWQLSLQSLGGSEAWNAAMFATSWQLGLVLLGNAICHRVADQTSFNTAASALKELNWQGSMALLHRAVAYRLQLEEVGWNIAMDAAGGGGWQRPLQLL
ncbi:unnamed protein product, partial [Effrenium voratum]